MDQFDKVIGYEREREKKRNCSTNFVTAGLTRILMKKQKNVRCSKMIVPRMKLP